MTTILNRFKEILSEKVEEAENYRSEKLKRHLINHYVNGITFQKQEGRNKSELVYSTEISLKDSINAILNCNFLKSFVTLYTENTKPLVCPNFSCQYQCVFIVQSHLSLVHKLSQWYTRKYSYIHESCVPTLTFCFLQESSV